MGIMATVVTLIIMGMLLQGIIAVVDSILDLAGVGGMLKGLPLVGANLSLIWAYLFVLATDVNGNGAALNFGASTEVLGLGQFGMDIATALAILAFVPVRDAAVSALGKGLGR
jgi:hypothetical protein|tara:strand:+ start:69 stop:407 length:339 start_codon:yes stop_codon:yes gene_type:complete